MRMNARKHTIAIPIYCKRVFVSDFCFRPLRSIWFTKFCETVLYSCSSGFNCIGTDWRYCAVRHHLFACLRMIHHRQLVSIHTPKGSTAYIYTSTNMIPGIWFASVFFRFASHPTRACLYPLTNSNGRYTLGLLNLRDSLGSVLGLTCEQ